MAVYPLHKNHKEGTVLHPQTSFYSEEYARNACSWYLTDHVYKDRGGRILTNYRLHSNKPRTFAEYMAYDIICPKCGHRMQPIATAQSYHNLALYSCQHCYKK